MRNFEQIAKSEVIEAQEAWANAVIEQDVEALLSLYDFGLEEEPVLFKPTLADVIRTDEAGARSYFEEGTQIILMIMGS